MKKISFILIILLIQACESEDIEVVKIGTNKTEKLGIKKFSVDQKAKNIILVIGDGVGLNQITLSRIAQGGPNYRLAIDQLPHQGLSLTHSYQNIYTDSAAAATSWATGHKTKNKYIGIDPKKNRLNSITEMLHLKGYSSGLIATSSITHATPAAFYAHTDSRYKENEIANQLIESNIDIALGGGQKFFDINKLENTHHVFLEKISLSENIDQSKKIIGIFDEDGIRRSFDKPSQQEMTAYALERLFNLNEKCRGFFLMTEGSQIDWAAHSNEVQPMIREFMDFDMTIRDLINFISNNKETLLVVTADHETGGLQILNQLDKNIQIQWGTKNHTSIPVGVYAYGPGAHLFNGIMDNTEIHQKMLEAIDFNNLSEEICNVY